MGALRLVAGGAGKDDMIDSGKGDRPDDKGDKGGDKGDCNDEFVFVGVK